MLFDSNFQIHVVCIHFSFSRLTLIASDVATRPQHSIQTYATPLHLDLAFNSHPQTATNYQSQLQQQQQQTDTTYQQSLASPDSSAPTTPYHNMASQFSQPVTPFELHAANPLSTAAAENYNYFESSAHFSHNPPTQHNGQSQHQSSASPADEDKRQRNSAASARFRAKRKQREEALQSETRQKQQSLQQLETKVKSLEAENLFLRRLLIEKDNVEEKINDKGDETEEGERHVTGVGTSGENAAKKGKGKGREVGRK